MPSISFALILNENLKNPVLNVPQMESVINIQGDPGPRELQRIRDLVSDSFLDRRKNINDLITTAFNDLSKAQSANDAQKIVTDFNSDMRKAVANFDKEMQKRVTRVVAEDAMREEAAVHEDWKFVCETAWDAVKLTKDGIGLFNDIGELVTGPDVFKLITAGKGLFDLTRDARSLVGSLCDAWRSVEDQQNDVLDILKKIKKTKQGEAPKLSDVKSAQDGLETLSAKIDKLDKSADSIARVVDDMLKLQVGKAFDQSPDAKAAENHIADMLTQLVTLNGEIANRRKFEKSCDSFLKDAVKKAKGDSQYWLSWVFAVYDLVNDLNDMREETDNLYENVTKLKTVGDRLMELSNECKDGFENAKEAQKEIKKSLT